jgi:hypothetical protein
MKKIFFVFFILLLTVSCSDDDNTNYHYELLPVEDAIVPDEFIHGQVYFITVKYIRPDDCYVYNDVLYEYDYDARNIAVISTVIENENCEVLDSEEELTIRVQALQTSPYIFRFWQGDDENGDPIYLEIIVPVV